MKINVYTIKREIGTIDIRHIYDVDAPMGIDERAVLVASGVYPNGNPKFSPNYNFKQDAKSILDFLKKEIPFGTFKALKKEIDNNFREEDKEDKEEGRG